MDSYSNKLSALRQTLLLLLLLGFSQYSLAQDNVGEDSTIIYPASYFAEYAPVTALDMINRIPGMNVSSGGNSRGGSAGRGGRGLGSGGGGTQILINSKRTAGKNNNTQNQLVRINADQVDYIEIIRGTSGDLDVRGSTQIANVVLYEQQSSSSLSYEVNADYYQDDKTEPGGSVSYGGQAGKLNFLFSGVAEPRYNHRESEETSILGDFSPNDEIYEDRIREQTSYSLSTNLDYQISDKSSARFNALYAENDDPTDVTRQTMNLIGGANTSSWEREEIPGTNSNWELGGDYEYRFDNGSRFKVLFISNENDKANTRERYDVFADGSEEKNLYLDSASILQERIVRGSYTTDIFGDQNIEMGIERAQTILNSKLRLAEASSTGIAAADFGGLVPVSVSNANTEVEEMRYEPFAIHNWRLNSRMSLETSFIYETSEITQTGDFNNQRDFSFFKPKIDYRFDITPSLQIRFLVEKFVRQINFSDFVAATDSDDNDSSTQAGNTSLRPDFWWNYNLLAEYRLAEDAGVVSANLYKHHHVDFLQRIDVSTSEDDLKSAAGNIGTGDMWVLDIKASIRLRMFNLPNVLVTTRASVRDSETKDPFLNIDRSFTNFHRGQFDIGFRHDIPQWRLNYGVSWNNRFDGDYKRVDIDDIESQNGDPFVMAFVEFVAFNDITFRFDARNATDAQMCRSRERYIGRTSANILEEIESMCSGSGRVLSLKVSGAF